MSDEWSTGSTKDLFAALDVIAEELNRAGEYEYEGITLAGDDEDYEQAYRCFTASAAIDIVVESLRNIVDMERRTVERAPLYRGADGAKLLADAANRFATGDGFASLPLRYTPSVHACSLADEVCEQYVADELAKEM